MAILSLSSSIEVILATLLVLALVGLLLRWDYVRLCRRINAARDEDYETSDNWSWPERHAGPASRSDRLPYGRKP